MNKTGAPSLRQRRLFRVYREFNVVVAHASQFLARLLRIYEVTQLDSPESKRAGRPPIFNPGRRMNMQKVHLNIATDVWNALRLYSETIDEPSLSRVARLLLRERLTQLGYLKNER